MPYIEEPGQEPGQGGQQPPPFTFFPGLPPELQEQVAEFLRNNDMAGAMAFVRASQWYQVAYAGIQELMQAGLISNWANPEAEYAQWKNSVVSSYQRFYGRPPSIDELRGFALRGADARRIEQEGQGYAIGQARGNEWQYLSSAFGTGGGALSPEELKALGEQEAGLGSTLGTKIKEKVDLAMRKMESVFKGSQASSAALESSIGKTLQRRQRSDIGF